MELITWILIGISLLFFLMLIVKSLTRNKKFCAICFSVSLTWVTLLILYFLKIFNDKILIAILMGHTSLGLFYLWEKNVREKFKVFRLSLLLTFIFIIYSILEIFSFSSLIFLIILWFLFFIIYIFRTKKNMRNFFNKILECCRNW